ncbi:hypothetical protein N7524_008651 [Penicillium chrysogenum]|nr:hypothetical protein N7524_008651 [Penicillium chrysogenum]
MGEGSRQVPQGALKPRVELKSTIGAGFPIVKGDPLRFRQVLQNLVSNAVNFTDNGHIQINATYSVDEKDPDVDQGTSLGLPICKILAELMDGAVGFHANTDGPGSVFRMTAKMTRIDLPVAETKKRLPSVTTAAFDNSAALQKAAPHKHILLVEDKKINQTVMLKLLGSLGFERVDAAWDGAEAVRLVKQKPLTYNVILMDINMPVMDGLLATEHIRQMKLDVPIIALTGNALKEDAEMYMAKGMNDYIAKPLHRQKLVDLLWKWCGS